MLVNHYFVDTGIQTHIDMTLFSSGTEMSDHSFTQEESVNTQFWCQKVFSCAIYILLFFNFEVYFILLILIFIRE